IAVASFVFAVLHPAWTWPLIFVLAVGMGYAYERTGNLWVPVFIHLFFNTINTVVTLLSSRFEPPAPPL
ncbi:MAG: CPBP family intramembrane glutamic endopeptidase, partial [Tepidisphaeraceae bacterium]